MGRIPRKGCRRDLGLIALEPRWMFDGAAVADAAHAVPDASARAPIPDGPAPVQVKAADPARNSGRKEVVFVDTGVADYQALEAAVTPGIEIEEIDGGTSGLAQIAKWAETHSGYDSISILSHGAEAQVQLGTDTLTAAAMGDATVQAELATIGHALNAGGDLLLYGCEVAKGEDGRQFIATLATATGADLAASTDTTGQGGNWALEAATGAIGATLYADADYAHALASATFTMDALGYATGLNSYTETSGGVTLTLTTTETDWNDTFYTSGGTTTTEDNGYHTGTNFVYTFSFDSAVKLISMNFSRSGGSSISDWTMLVQDNNGNQLSATSTDAYGAGWGPVSYISSLGGSFPTQTFNWSNVTSFTITVTPVDMTSYYNFQPLIDNLKFVPAAGVTPGAPTTAMNLNTGSDSAGPGGSTFDKITNVASPTFRVSLAGTNADAGDSVELLLGGASLAHPVTATLTATDIANGYCYLSATSGDLGADGSKTLTARVTDANYGLTGAAGGALTITLDTTAPGAPTTTIDLATASDSAGPGGTNTDNITKTITPTLRVSLAGTGAVANDSLELLLNGASLAHAAKRTLTATDITNGYYDFSVTSGDLGSSGTKVFTAQVTDRAGNVGAAGGALSVTLDTVAPSAPGTAITLATASDTAGPGGTTSDNITKTTNPTLRVSLNGTGAVAGDSVELLLGGASLAHPCTRVLTATDITNGYYDFTVTAGDLGSSGSKIFTARVTDIAGNVGTAGGSLSVTLDTTAPGAPTTTIDLATASDTAGPGGTTTDNVTKTTNPTIRVFLGGTSAVANDSVELLLGGASLTHPCTRILTSSDISNGYYDFVITSGDLGADGSKTLTARVTDVAGNVGAAGGTLSLTLDTTAPGAPTTTIDLATASDTAGPTGTSTDNITKTTNPTVRVFLAGTGAVANDSLELLLGGASLAHPGTRTLTSADITAGYYDFTVTTGDLGSSGTKTFTARVTDKAGNVGTAGGTLAVILDTTAPVVTTALTQTMTPAAASDGATVCALASTDATNIGGYTDAVSYSISGGADASKFSVVSGNLVVNNAGGLTAGTYVVQVQATDTAGNAGTATITVTVGSSATVTSINRAASTPSLTNASSYAFDVTFSQPVSGVAASNFSLTGTRTGGSITGVTSSDGGTTWRVTVGGVTADGTLGVTLSTIAGIVSVSDGTSPLSGTHAGDQIVTIDTTAPQVSGVSLSGSRFRQGDTGTATIQLAGGYDGHGSYVLGPGSSINGLALTGWAYDSTNNRGTASFTVTGAATEIVNGTMATAITVVDASGNSGTYTTPLSGMTVDTHAPAGLTVEGFTSGATKTGTAPVAAGSVVGTLAVTDGTPNDVFTFTLGGADAARFQVVNGVLMVGAGQALTPGTLYAITVSVTDAGGNTLAAPQAMAITAQAPQQEQKDIPHASPPSTSSPTNQSQSSVPSVTSIALPAVMVTAIHETGSAPQSVSLPATAAPPAISADTGGSAVSQGTPSTTAVAVIGGADAAGNRTNGVAATAAGAIQAPAVVTFAASGQLTAAPGDGSAFRVPVIAAGQRAGAGDALLAVRPMALVQETAAGTVSFALPVDTFAHTRPDAVVTLKAAQADGQPLPAWLAFDPKTGAFVGRPPAGLEGEVVVRVVARDQDGREAATTVRITLGEKQAAQGGPRSGRADGLRHGKLAFSQQLKHARPGTALSPLARWG